MHNSLIQLAGQELSLQAYLDDFQKNFWGTDESGCWKIERQQEFAEPGDDSWEAYIRGDWDEALRLVEAKRRDIAQYYKQVRKHGFDVRRIRVVQEPISSYLIWELHVLNVRAQCGAQVHVVDVAEVQHLERAGSVPEVFILGRSIAYQVLYSEAGVAAGAIRATDHALIAQWTDVAKQLYSAGEPMEEYFKRRVQGLRPPHSGGKE